ncbi:hypothetical protein SG71_17300 [Enterobacter chengduensis]|uniref:Uncharacterized protein n=1 Tax=Enterobacter chengduensis TaxID=2494701 RepID=A0AAW3HD70_9ENTR|nr:hypothetical protein SG71_17300 [Enterobacter chengduensis]
MAKIEAMCQVPNSTDDLTSQHVFGLTMRKVSNLDTVIVSYPIISLFHNSPLKLFHLEVYMTMQNLAVDKTFF